MSPRGLPGLAGRAFLGISCHRSETAHSSEPWVKESANVAADMSAMTAVVPGSQCVQRCPEHRPDPPAGPRNRRPHGPGQGIPGAGSMESAQTGLNAQAHSALRSTAADGRPGGVAGEGSVMVARASARLARECADRARHFIATYATACACQVTVGRPGAAHGVGSPVTGSNSRPRRAARTSSAR
jgi:hypothetical protein